MKNNITRVLFLAVTIAFLVYLGLWLGVDLSIKALLIVMAIDYLIGVALAITGKSKHGSGLSSDIGYQGLIKKNDNTTPCRSLSNNRGLFTVCWSAV